MFERLRFLMPAPRDIGLPRQLDRVAVHLHVYPRDAIRVAPRHKPDPGVEPDLHPVEASGRAGLTAVRRLHPGHHSMSRKQTWWVAAVVASIALAAGFSPRPAALRPPGAGMSAEAFFAQTFNDLDGQPVEMARWQGRIVVVNFWATWCPPCVEEMPDLQRVHDEYADRGVTVVGTRDRRPVGAEAVPRRAPACHCRCSSAGASGSEIGRTPRQSVGRACRTRSCRPKRAYRSGPPRARSSPPNCAAGSTLSWRIDPLSDWTCLRNSVQTSLPFACFCRQKPLISASFCRRRSCPLGCWSCNGPNSESARHA